MARFRNTAVFLALGVALAGCADQVWPTQHALMSNKSSYSENQPVVEHTNYAIDLATDGRGIASGEIGRLSDWLVSIDLRYGDHVWVEDGGNEARADVARVLGHYGLLLEAGSSGVPGSVPPGAARVIVARATASVPGCPNWRQAKFSGAPIGTESNYGCAMNSNLAAMVADPNDLVLGQERHGSQDAETASKAIKSYRETAPSGKGAALSN